MENQAANLQPTKISIGGERFQIQTDLSSEELQRIISYIEIKMKEHLTPSLRAEPRKQLILMSMEITAELFEARSRIAELENAKDRCSLVAEKLLDLLTSELEGKSDQALRSTKIEDPLESARNFLSPLG